MGKIVAFQYDHIQAAGYLAIPDRQRGPGVLVLHAWWGLNSFFQSVCDRLAQEGFVAFAPDLYGDLRTAAVVADAERLMDQSNGADMNARVVAATDFLAAMPEIQGEGLGVIGFSMGAFWATQLSVAAPDKIAAVVLLYGSSLVDFTQARAAYQGHYAEGDEWEPELGVRAMEQKIQDAGLEAEIFIYPAAHHWFMESDRPGDHHPPSAGKAWSRASQFLHARLDSPF